MSIEPNENQQREATMRARDVLTALNAKMVVLGVLSDEAVGAGCSKVPVPPTVGETDEYRRAYSDGYRQALTDSRRGLAKAASRIGSIAAASALSSAIRLAKVEAGMTHSCPEAGCEFPGCEHATT